MFYPVEDCTPEKFFISANLSLDDWVRTNATRITGCKVSKGETLYSAGQAFYHLSAVRTGYFKSSAINRDGEEVVSGFHLPGELLGLDGLFGGAHQLEIVALVDSDLCSIAATEVQPLLADVPAIVQFFYQFLWKDVRRTRSFMTALSQRGAEQRVATFLVNFGKRLHHRGYSQSEFRLPMSRSDLGSYLMLQQETISRALTFLVERRYIELDNRAVKILQLDALRDFRGKRVN